ncbi:MAG: PIG-L family deacetylase [Bacteroidota bacterium]
MSAFTFFALFTLPAFSQAPKSYSSSDIEQMLRKLKVCGTVLYVAAHPDDENTRLIACLAQDRKLDVYYLSLTRGDGGQNLIGSELGEGLGVIRTQELLAARRTDGGKQLFSRARDFGFSKNPEETFTIWPREEVLRDAVRIIRQIRPDVIITRFNPEPSPTHGHHTASAQIGLEAFKAAADPNRFPEDMKRDHTSPYQARRIFWNISSFFFAGREKEFRAEQYLKIDVGTFNPISGKSYQDNAADSRSMHKSQGFGSAGARGPAPDYFKQLGGDSAKTDILENIDISWNRFPQGKIIEAKTDSALKLYDPSFPYKAALPLLHALQYISKTWVSTPESLRPLLKSKSEQLEEALYAVLGLRIEACNAVQTMQPGQALNLTLEAANRSSLPVKALRLYGQGLDSTLSFDISPLKPLRFTIKGGRLSSGYTDPYWLRKPGTAGLFSVPAKSEYDDNLPENTAPSVKVRLNIAGQESEINVPVRYRVVDPVKGELYRPLEVIPAVTLEPAQKVLITDADKPFILKVKLTAQAKTTASGLRITGITGLDINPTEIPVPALANGQEFEGAFSIKSTGSPVTGNIAFKFGDSLAYSLQRIRYDHIPDQVILRPASVKVLPFNGKGSSADNNSLKITGKHIGYIMGAGDEVPEALRLMGYQVDMLTQADINPSRLKSYDAVVTGVRAWNTHAWLKQRKNMLLDYMKQGGNLVVQYNTANFLSGGTGILDSIAPYPFKLSNDRVTNENSPVNLLAADNPALNTPNKITQADFTGWVQERGIYFPKEWASQFTPLLGMNDPGETEMKGSVLVAPVGKGNYVYTGLSFFRQLPAGVPGAYRLMANLVSLKHK